MNHQTHPSRPGEDTPSGYRGARRKCGSSRAVVLRHASRARVSCVQTLSAFDSYALMTTSATAISDRADVPKGARSLQVARSWDEGVLRPLSYPTLGLD